MARTSHVMEIGVGCASCRGLWAELKEARREIARLKGEAAAPEPSGYVGWGRYSKRGRWFPIPATAAETEKDCLAKLLENEARGLDLLAMPAGKNPNAEELIES
jgi:hypothetical protein